MSEAAAAKTDQGPLIIGRYALFDAIASGGMATVHLGRLLGSEGFGRTVAVKRLHSHYTTDQDFVTMFMDEARIVARIRHPNVVPMVDVLESSKGLFLIMEYVHGESFSKLVRTCRSAKEPIALKMVTAIMHGVLLGLHAAHETKGVNGELLDVVHRDVSPQNIMVGADGTARVLDFGVAKAAGRAQVTREGQIKGKLAYMAPEQIRGKVDRRADVFAAAVVLWEALAGRRLHEGAKDVEIVTRVVQGKFPAPSEFRPDIPPELDVIVLRGLEIDPDKRYPNAREMAIDLERKVGCANPSEVGEWVERLAPEVLRVRAEKVAAMEKAASGLLPSESVPPPPFPTIDSSSIQSPAGGDAEPVRFADHHGSSPPGPMEFTTVMEGAPPTPPSFPAAPHGASSVSNVSHPPPSSTSSSGSSSSGAASRSGSGITDTTGSHTNGTPMGTALPMHMPLPRRDLAPLIALVSFCGALALVGAVLGGFSLYARSAPGSQQPLVPTSSTTTAAHPATTPSAAPTPSTSASSAPHTKGATSGKRSDNNNNAADASTTAAATATTAATPNYAQPQQHVVKPAPSSSPKKNCDPPYTVDDNGHRHYKLECME